MSKNIVYEPLSGAAAGRRNRKRVKEYLEENPGATGVEISKALGLSLVTVYSHLNRFRKR